VRSFCVRVLESFSKWLWCCNANVPLICWRWKSALTERETLIYFTVSACTIRAGTQPDTHTTHTHTHTCTQIYNINVDKNNYTLLANNVKSRNTELTSLLHSTHTVFGNTLQ